MTYEKAVRNPTSVAIDGLFQRARGPLSLCKQHGIGVALRLDILSLVLNQF